MTVEEIKKEIERRQSFVHDELIGQSPEDLERHYKLIGRQEAFTGLLKFINKDVEEGNRLQMGEAVEGEFMLNPYPIICLDDCKNYDFKDGDKVRVLIVNDK